MRAPDAMPAAYVSELGPADRIRVGELPVPRPGATDVLVKVLATTTNRVDTFVRSGAFRTPVRFPLILNRDLVGTVVEAGPEASRFRPGQAVWSNSLGHAGRQGAAAGFAAVPADRLYPLPPGVDEQAAVAVLHPAATACLALFTWARLQPAETVLVAGAAGAVGSALVTLAVTAGARVIATAHPRDHDYCRALGAFAVVDYHAPDRAEQVSGLSPGGIDVYLDTSGANDLIGAVDLLAGMGTRPVLPAGKLYLKDGSVLGFVISHAHPTELATAAELINSLLAAGKLRPRAVTGLPLKAAALAHRRVEAGDLHGERLVLLPWE